MNVPEDLSSIQFSGENTFDMISVNNVTAIVLRIGKK
jgi:hypothetical protein